MSRPSISRKIFAGTLVFLGLVAVFVWINHLAGNRSLQAWKAQMAARGEKFSIDEIAPPTLSSVDTNLFRFNAAADQLRSRSIEPGNFKPLEIAGPGEATALWMKEVPDRAPDRTNTWAMVAQQLAAAQKSLDEIHEVLQTPAAASGMNYRSLGPSGNYTAKRSTARWLALATMFELHEGRLPSALTSLRSLIRLSRLHEDDLTLINQMIRVAIADLALDATWAALQAPGWTDEKLAELQHEWERPKWLEEFPPTWEMERAMTLTWFAYSRSNGIASVRPQFTFPPAQTRSAGDVVREYVFDPVWRIAWSASDELNYLKEMQPTLDATRTAVQHKSWVRLSAELNPPRVHSSSILDKYNGLRFQMSRMVWGNFVRAHEAVMRTETYRGLTVAAISLKRYRRRHGKFPPDLDALSPEFFAAVPVDYMDGRPLRYRLESDGLLHLYSVGLGGVDDGGSPQPVVAWKRYSGLWDGRDAVWPRLASLEVETPVLAPEVLPLVKFEDAPLFDVIRILAKQADLQVQIEPNVLKQSFPAVSLRLENVTAQDILQAVLANNNLILVKHARTNLVGITWK